MTNSSFQKPLLNATAFVRSLLMWFMPWTVLVLYITYQGQPGILFLTPVAWGLAVPVGLNYVAFSRGNYGKNAFVAGTILGATFGFLLGMLCLVLGSYTIHDDGTGQISGTQIWLILLGIGVVVSALFSGLTAARAARVQRRGKELIVIKPM